MKKYIIGLLILIAVFDMSGKDLSKFSAIINKHCQRFDIDTNLIKAIIIVESNGNPNAKGINNCNGLMQIKEGTFNPSKNVYTGVSMIKTYIDRYKDTMKALTAYNRGIGWVRKNYKKPSKYSLKVMKIYYGLK